MRIYDISAVISESLPVYAGDPGVEIRPRIAIANGGVCNVSMLTFGSHTGTHADMPKHFFDGGLTCDTIPLDCFCGKARLYDLRARLSGRKSVTPEDLAGLEMDAGDIILLNTGNSPLMRESRFTPDYVSLSPEAAEDLAGKKIKALGIDYLSVERFGGGFEAHRALLGAGIAILEGLVFDETPEGHIPGGGIYNRRAAAENRGRERQPRPRGVV
jgi:arylformamidase